MLGGNLWDSDTVALPATGKTAQLSFVKGLFFHFSHLFVPGCVMPMNVSMGPGCQVRAAEARRLPLSGDLQTHIYPYYPYLSIFTQGQALPGCPRHPEVGEGSQGCS